MSQTISQQLEEAFRQASASFVRGKLKTERDVAEFESISRGAAAKEEELISLYREEYGTRVDAARRQLYDEAAQRHLDHPAPPGGGGDDRAGAIDREAHRQVKLAHENDLQQARVEAQEAFEELLDRAHRRHQTKGMAVDAFLQASDRRSGHDRRTVKPSQD